MEFLTGTTGQPGPSDSGGEFVRNNRPRRIDTPRQPRAKRRRRSLGSQFGLFRAGRPQPADNGAASFGVQAGARAPVAHLDPPASGPTLGRSFFDPLGRSRSAAPRLRATRSEGGVPALGPDRRARGDHRTPGVTATLVSRPGRFLRRKTSFYSFWTSSVLTTRSTPRTLAESASARRRSSGDATEPLR